jgi:hypothetical protein
MAMDFPTQDAMDKYLKEHPDADKSKHKVEKKEHHPVVQRALGREQHVVNIGQLSSDEKNALEKAVKDGILKKGKGGGFPVLKTVYSHPDYDIEGEHRKSIEELKNAQKMDEQNRKKKSSDVVARALLMVAKRLMAIDFPTQGAMDKYLKEHPDADKSNHKVVEQKKSQLPTHRSPKKVKSIGGKSPEDYASQWGSTKGQGAAHFYNYGSEKQKKDAKFFDEFIDGKGGIRETMKMVSDSLNAGEKDFSSKDLDNLSALLNHVEAEKQDAKRGKAVAAELVTIAKGLVSGTDARASMGNGTPTEAQDKSIKILERKGFRYVSDFVVSGEFTVVMQRRRGPSTYSGEVEEDGSVNGEPVEEFLRSSPA